MRKTYILAVSFAFGAGSGIAGYASADLGTLIEVGRSQAEMQKHYKEETENYKRIKRALDSGALTMGKTRNEVEKEYGEPVVTYNDSGKNMEKWIYKSADSSFFGGPQVCLFFDDIGKLADIESRE